MKHYLWNSWKNYILLALFLDLPFTHQQNLPITLSVPREWHIHPSTTPGTKVSQIKLSPESAHLDNVRYGIEPSFNQDVSGYFNVSEKDGAVFLGNKKLESEVRVGYLQLTASAPGTATSKVEVRVTFGEQSGSGGGAGSGRPFWVGLTTPKTLGTTTEGPVTLGTTTTTTEKTTTTTPTTITTTITTTTTLPKKEENNTHLAIIIAVVVTLLLTSIAAVLFFLHRKKRTAVLTKEIRKTSTTTATAPTNPARALSNRYEDAFPSCQKDVQTDSWEIPRHRVKIMSILGEGCFGQVWMATLIEESGLTTTVACKTLKGTATSRDREDLLSELAVLKSLEPHPNVVRLLGCCVDEENPPFVLLEYVALGKLQSFLRSSRDSHDYGNLHSDSRTLTSKDLTSFSLQVAKGMDFLSQKGIIHRDLAARNVLLDKDQVTCKVADFGFARDVLGVEGMVYERKKGDARLPIRWMAPESLYDSIFTTKSDVWSFGVLMWEIVTLGSTPYPGLSPAAVMKSVSQGSRLEKPLHCKRELYNIMFYCWNHTPVDRPSFSDLTKFLAALIEEDQDYIQLDLFPEHSYYNLENSEQEERV